jgi:hypothetical protein
MHQFLTKGFFQLSVPENADSQRWRACCNVA